MLLFASSFGDDSAEPEIDPLRDSLAFSDENDELRDSVPLPPLLLSLVRGREEAGRTRRASESMLYGGADGTYPVSSSEAMPQGDVEDGCSDCSLARLPLCSVSTTSNWLLCGEALDLVAAVAERSFCETFSGNMSREWMLRGEMDAYVGDVGGGAYSDTVRNGASTSFEGGMMESPPKTDWRAVQVEAVGVREAEVAVREDEADEEDATDVERKAF